MTTSHEEITFSHKGIGDVLLQNRLVVPLNQREYSWEEEHVRDLFTDFANAVANDKATYFLGTVVLTRGETNIPEVSDGQQRLATTTILLAAIRDHLARHDDPIRANKIDSDFLTTIDFATTDRVPRLRLNVDDNDFFTKYVLAPPGTPDRKVEPTKESHERIAEAAKIAAEHVKNILAPYNEAQHIARLTEWLEFLTHGASVIVLDVPDHMNAFVMFETLNDRGLKASQADLIKNHLLSFAKTRIAEAQTKWAEMIGTLESLGQDEIAVTYLHHLLITKHGPMKAAAAFDTIRLQVTGEKRALDFLDDIAATANDYAALFNSDHAKWNAYGTSTRRHISTINRDLQVSQIRPLMLAVARHFSVPEAKKAFRLFVFWSVRFLVAGGRGGLLDRHYALQAQAIGTGKVKTAKDLAKALAEIIPTDALFETAFAEARVSQTNIARYYLRALEAKRTGDPEPELIQNDDEGAVNLEHILPRNPQDEWPHIDSETASAYWRRLGNMVIIQATKNSIIGNSSFSTKKPVLAKSGYLLTKEVANDDEWGPLEITARQQRLAKLAVETWPIS